MRKDIRDNMKKITAIVLITSMTLSANISAFAYETQIGMPTEDSLSCETEISTNEITIEKEEVTCDVEETPSAADLAERAADDNVEYSADFKLGHYLYQKYPELRALDGKNGGAEDQSLSTCEYKLAESVTSLEIGGDFDIYPVGKNMVNFSSLSYLPNLQSLVIDGVDEIRTIYLPTSLTSLEIKNTTLNFSGACGHSLGFFSESSTTGYSGVGSCNFTKFVLDNCTIGDFRRGNSTNFTDTVEIKLKKSSNLRELKINLAFASEDLKATVNAGSDFTFDGLNSGSCEINKIGEKGRIIISSGNPDSYFCKHYTIVYEPKMDEDFKKYLLKQTSADTNGDTFLSVEELNAITKLDIVYDEHNGNYLDALHDLSDIEKLNGLEELNIDLRYGVRYIRSISFPDNGKLKSVSITNTAVAFGDKGFIVPSVETFDYTNNIKASITGDSTEYVSNIRINDTLGKLSSVKLDNSNVKSIVLSNTGTKRTLNFSATGCNKLESIELQNNGYDFEQVDLNNSTLITEIGYKDTPSTGQWTINCVPNSNGQACFDVTNCTAFATVASDTIINFDIASDQSAVILAYGVNGVGDNHKLTINRKNSVGTVYLYYDNTNTWMAGKYGSQDGYTPKTGSSTPNIAVFENKGNHIRTIEKAGATPYERWVDYYDVVLCKGGDMDEKSSDLVFYVEEEVGGKHIKRKINHDDLTDISLEVVGDTNVIRFYYGNGIENISDLEKIFGKNVGVVTINIYIGTGADKKMIGKQNIMVRELASNIDLTIHHSESGSFEDPIHIEKNSGRLKLSGKIEWPNDNPILPEDDVESVMWIVAEYSERSSNWIDMSASTATSYGIRVVGDSTEGEDPNKINTREFSFTGGTKTFFKFVAQEPYKDLNGNFIRKECYVEITGPCVITPEADTLVPDSSGTGSLDITLTGCKNYDIAIKDAEKYNNLLKVSQDASASDDSKSVWKLSTNGSDYEAIKNMMDSQKSVTLVITADYGVHEKTINLRSSLKTPDDSTPTPEPTPNQPVSNNPTTTEPTNSNNTNQVTKEQATSFVSRMYNDALSRDAEPTGLNYWVNQLVEQKIDGAGLAKGFICSKEFAEKNLNNEEYVKVLYETFFGRSADADGLKYWVDILNSGKPRTEVLAGFVNSREFSNVCDESGIVRGTMEADGSSIYNPGVNSFVNRMYKKALDRKGESVGVEYWSYSINKKQFSPEEVAKRFFLSEEYAKKEVSDEEYVETLYETFMGRSSDADGKAYWLNALKSGKTRESVLEGFSRSREFSSIMAEFGL